MCEGISLSAWACPTGALDQRLPDIAKGADWGWR